jgi:SAM-dependent methyltransferase
MRESAFGVATVAEGYAKFRPPVHEKIIGRIAGYLGAGSKVELAVDIGCGAGLSTRPLENLAAHCVGIEPVEAMLRWHASIAPGSSFLVGCAEALPFPAASIDLMTAAGSLNFANLDKFFPEAQRVLKRTATLAVYDFSRGRVSRQAPKLATWYGEFMGRYPSAPNSARPLSPEILTDLSECFSLASHETFKVELPLDHDFYLEYVLTETNVSHAIQAGTPESSIRTWCAETLRPVFTEGELKVTFEAYIAYMVPIATDN